MSKSVTPCTELKIVVCSAEIQMYTKFVTHMVTLRNFTVTATPSI